MVIQCEYSFSNVNKIYRKKGLNNKLGKINNTSRTPKKSKEYDNVLKVTLCSIKVQINHLMHHIVDKYPYVKVYCAQI